MIKEQPSQEETRRHEPAGLLISAHANPLPPEAMTLANMRGGAVKPLPLKLH